jgi:tetratricopeptide (TPR) repeat protein
MRIRSELPDMPAAEAKRLLTGLPDAYARLEADFESMRQEVDRALASFERVSLLFPRTSAVPVALQQSGWALRIVDRNEEAAVRYREVITRYPRTPSAALAGLGLARVLVRVGRVSQAIEELQRVRQRFPDTPEAAIALAQSTILYRLYIRPAAGQPPYGVGTRVFAGTTGKLKDVFAIAVGPDDTVATVN